MCRVATTYDPLRVLKRPLHGGASATSSGCNHLRPAEGTETTEKICALPIKPCCNHLRPAEGTETLLLEPLYFIHELVATTYDPLRVLKHRPLALAHQVVPRCNHLRPAEGTETFFLQVS